MGAQGWESAPRGLLSGQACVVGGMSNQGACLRMGAGRLWLLPGVGVDLDGLAGLIFSF